MRHPFYRFCWRLVRTLGRLLWRLKAVDEDNIPVEGPVIVAVNHQSYLDPPLVAVVIRREMHFFAKKELFGIFILGNVIANLNAIPVRRGVYDPVSLSRAQAALDEGGGLILFPEGTRGDGRTFLRPKPGVGLIARQTGAAIVPAYAHRTHRPWNCLLTRRPMRIYFGPPITAEEVAAYGDDKEGYRALADDVMARIGRLKDAVADK